MSKNFNKPHLEGLTAQGMKDVLPEEDSNFTNLIQLWMRFLTSNDVDFKLILLIVIICVFLYSMSALAAKNDFHFSISPIRGLVFGPSKRKNPPDNEK